MGTTIVLNNRDNLFYDKSRPEPSDVTTIFGDSDGLLSVRTGGSDIIFALHGSDNVFGDAYEIDGANRAGGNDQLHGGAGSDRMYGDAYTLSNGARGGADVLVQGSGSGLLVGDGEFLWSGAVGGNDHLRGAGSLYGDGSLTDAFGGNDVLDASQASTGSHLAGDGDLWGASVGGRDVLTGSAYADELFGDGLIMSGSSRGGGDVIDGGGGNDHIYGDAAMPYVDEVGLRVTGGNDNLRGGSGRDVVIGDFQTDSGRPICGDDTIAGGAGNDLLVGDILNGHANRPGDDIFRFAGAFGNDKVRDFGRGDDRLVFQGYEAADISIDDSGPDTIVTIADGGTVTLMNYGGALIEGDNLFFA